MQTKNKTTNVIFVTGGVISGIGKGVSAASVGNLLKAHGYDVIIQKLDPYLNVDPGVLSPYEHGEVYVTADGGETDLDLGHYERFLNQVLSKNSNYTSGKIFQTIFENERKGLYNGKTVQIIPHFTNEIIRIINDLIKNNKPDFLIVEIGGTVGDFESNAFIHAASQFGYLNPTKTFYIHVTYIPWLQASNEHKTKPTQQSLTELAAKGIKANLVFLRSNVPIDDSFAAKIAQMSFIDKENIINVPNIQSIYHVPNLLLQKNVTKIILNHFNLEYTKPKMKEWDNFTNLISVNKTKTITIAMVGKYIELEDAYKSIVEAIKISSCYAKVNLKLRWVSACKLNKQNINETLRGVDGVLILPGFGERGLEGKILAANYTRDKKIPTFGICYGMQAMVINQARLKGIKDATSHEVSDKGSFVLDIIEGKNVQDLGGTLRLGEDYIDISNGTLAYKVYQKSRISERSRHRYEVNLKYVDQIVDDDFIFSGKHKQNLMEICELKKHPFYIGVQFHPEFNSYPLKPHPLFNSFVQACCKK